MDFGNSGFHRTLKRCSKRNVLTWRLLSKIADEATREYHRPDFVSIAPTIRPGFELQDFDFYYDYVVEKMHRMLESLWNI